MRRRLETLAAGLGMSVSHEKRLSHLVKLVSDGLSAADRSRVWLTLAVIRARFPLQDDFDVFWRSVAGAGPRAAVSALVYSSRHQWGIYNSADVRIVRGAVVVDVHHTARTGLATGIQRVARETVHMWSRSHEIEIVGWDDNFDGLRTLSAEERENALYGTQPDAAKPVHRTVTIPFESTYILPELAIEKFRTARLACFARESGNSTAVIGFDCVPLTSPETVGEGMGVAFSRNLTAVAHFDRVSTISESAGNEYLGWRKMLSGAGWTGPDIMPIMLPAVAASVTDEDIAAAREKLYAKTPHATTLPLVLCVGSHEPRKNHLAVLYAAEVLWREGLEFTLVFVGGNAWNSESFRAQLRWLAKNGRPVSSISAISDSLLWSAYRIADITVFPSLNEGFGLPVAESLAVGTPVITSRYGSMREIAEGGGAVLVDPRNDDDIVRGLRELLARPSQRQNLAKDAEARMNRTWEDYAAELWDYLVNGSTREDESVVQHVG
jgi:glycosyltransferase involved in cell wall biosynthesis